MSPKSKEQFEQIRSQSVAAIKQAALELFAHKGYHSTSISQIAKAAGVSKGLMYNYFEGKEALLEAILNDALSAGSHIMEKYLGEDGSPRERLDHLISATFQWVKNNLPYWKLMGALAFQSDIMERFEPILKQKTEEMFSMLEVLFEEMGSAAPKEDALLFGAMMDGVCMHYMHMVDQYPLEKVKEIALNRFCK